MGTLGRCLAAGLLAAGLLGTAATAASAQPRVISGQWELVVWVPIGSSSPSAPRETVDVIDIVRMSLGTPQLGALSGTWDETTVPQWEPGLALDPGVAQGSYAIKGSVDGTGYDLDVENANLGLNTFSSGFGSPPLLGEAHGCVPAGFTLTEADQGADLYLMDPIFGDSYLFFRPQWFPGVAVGKHVTCQAWPSATTPAPTSSSKPKRPTSTTQPLITSLKPYPVQVGHHGGTVALVAALKDAATCELELLSHQDFPVVYASNARLCTSNFSAVVTVGANPTSVDRTVAFALVARNGEKSVTARVYIVVAG
jgi:hypothetical protein